MATANEIRQQELLRQARPNSFGDAAAATANPGTTQPAGIPAIMGRFPATQGGQVTPNSPFLSAPSVRASLPPRPQGIAQAASPAPAPWPSLQSMVQGQPKATPMQEAPATQQIGWRTKAVMDGAAEDAQSAWDRGNWGQAAGAVTRGAITAIPTAIGEVAYDTLAPAGRVASQFYQGLTGGGASPPAATTPTPRQPAARGLVTAAGDANMPAMDASRPIGFGATSTPATAATPNTEIMPGIYRYGRGQYGDNPNGLGFTPRQPTQADMARMDSIAARVNQPAASQAAPEGGMSIMGGGGYGLRDPNTLAERNLLASVGSLRAAQERAGGFGGRRGQPGFAAADVALGNFYKDRAQGNELASAEQIQGMRTKAEMARIGADTQNNLVARALDERRIAEAERTGATTRQQTQQTIEQQQQMAALRNTLLDPKATPEQRKQAQDAILAIQGKGSAADRFLVVPGGQQIDTLSGKAYNTPSAVFNPQTGQFVQQPGQGGSQAPAVGAVQQGYRFKGGDPANPASWEKT